MTGWRESIRGAVRVCGVGRSAALLLLMLAYHYSAPTRRIRPRFAGWLLGLFGGREPVVLRLRRPRCNVWLRPFNGGDVQSFLEVFVRRLYPIPDGDVVLDAGANIGLFSVFALQEGTVKRLVAVEPDSDNVRLLRRNLDRWKQRVEIVEGALWSEDGRALFAKTNQSNVGHMASASGVEAAASGEVYVKTVSADNENLPRPEAIDYLKLDIEGAEGAVLGTYIRKMAPEAVLVGELHGEENINRFRPILRDKWTLIEDGPADCVVFSWSP